VMCTRWLANNSKVPLKRHWHETVTFWLPFILCRYSKVCFKTGLVKKVNFR
jgi:hypothetical protein